VRREVLKQERSLVVHSRVDVVKLADIALAMIESGYTPAGASSLVAGCVEQLHHALLELGVIKEAKRITSIAVAWQQLEILGYVTKTMKKQNKNKLNMAWGFENLRNEGVDPEQYAPMYYKKLHNQHSVKPVDVDMLVEIFDRTPASGRFSKPVQDEYSIKKAKELGFATVAEYKEWLNTPAGIAYGNKLVPQGPSNTKSLVLATDPDAPKPDEPVKLGRPRKVECEPTEVPSTDAPECELPGDDTPRKKTEDELERDAERIAKKDREIAMMDMSAPSANKTIK